VKVYFPFVDRCTLQYGIGAYFLFKLTKQKNDILSDEEGVENRNDCDGPLFVSLQQIGIKEQY